MQSYADFLLETVLGEAPLGDFQATGDLSREGSMRPEDIKAVQNPKWLKKLDSHFKRTPYRFNIYTFNATSPLTPDYADLPGQSYHALPDRHTNPDGSRGSRMVNFRNTNPMALEAYAGLYGYDDFERTFGFHPPEFENSISVMLVQNEGDSRLPLTPWIVAHRIAHAIQYAGRKYGSNSLRPQSMGSGEIYLANERAIEAIRQTLDKMSIILGFWDMDKKPYENIPMTKVASIIGKSKAMMSGIPEHRVGEVYMEIFTQFIVQGSVSFRTPELTPLRVDASKLGWLEIDDPELDEDKIRRLLSRHAENINAELRELFGLLVGKAIVF